MTSAAGLRRERLTADQCGGEDRQLVQEVYGITGDLRYSVSAAAIVRDWADGYAPAGGVPLTEDTAVELLINMRDRIAVSMSGRTLLKVLRVLFPEADKTRAYENELWYRRAKNSLERRDREIRAEMERLRAEENAYSADTTIDGATFILGRPPAPPALWGAGPDVLWARHQSLMIVAPTGVGKTTLAGLLIRAQLFGGDVLGLPVAPIDGKILVLAMDRPEQIGGALRRQFGEQHRDGLRRLVIRPGPPPADMAGDPAVLTKIAEHYDARVVYIDSLKDAALGLSNDAVGAGYNLARQTLIRSGRELAELHHLTKSGAQMFGSAWLAGGAGSVIQIDGDAGSASGRLTHRKQPAHKVGPWRLRFDRDSGEISRDGDGRAARPAPMAAVDLVALARDGGVTARTAAQALYGASEPTRAELQRARRALAREAEAGRLRLADQADGEAAQWLSV